MVYVSETFEREAKYGLISSAPSAQLRPTASRSIWKIECQNASTVWPDNSLPLASVMVPETITGIFLPISLKRDCIANNAALQFKVSKTVSIIKISTPPSNKPFACSLYASTN